MKNAFTVSEQTANFIKAGRSLEDAKTAILSALTSVYGEFAADNLYDEFETLFAPISAKLGQYVIMSETENL